MKWIAFLLAGLCFLTDGCCRLSADEPAPVKAPEIILPTIDGDPEPEPEPVPVPPAPRPKPKPRTMDTVSGDTWFVIRSNVPLHVRSYPTGFLSVLETHGPARVIEDGRQIDAEWLYILAPRKAGKTMLVLTAIDAGQISIVEQWLTVSGNGPQPPPVDPVVVDDVLAKCHAADRKSQIEILRQLAAKNLARDPQGLATAKEFVNAERIRRRSDDFGQYTDAIGEAIFGGTVGELADELEGKKQ